MGRRGRPSRRAGISVAELLIAATAFVVILGAAMSLLINWQRMNTRSEADVTAMDNCTRAINRITEDVRAATYLYHYATISIKKSGGTLLQYELPIVTENATADDVAGDSWPQSFFTDSNRASPDLMGKDSKGATTVLAMISDQPDGLNQPRYIIYWLGAPTAVLKSRGDRISAGGTNLYLRPLMRLEASPSNNLTNHIPDSWYTYQDRIAQTSAYSALYLTLDTTSKLASNSAMTGAIDVVYKLQTLTDVVTGPELSEPFTLRNYHPYSNTALYSPTVATISLRTSKALGPLRARANDGREVDVFELNTLAFARNVPPPQAGN